MKQSGEKKVCATMAELLLCDSLPTLLNGCARVSRPRTARTHRQGKQRSATDRPKFQTVVRLVSRPRTARTHRQGKQRSATDRRSLQVDAGDTRLKFVPGCQRSIAVVSFLFRKSRRAQDFNPGIFLDQIRRFHQFNKRHKTTR